MANTIKHRRASITAWTANNPVLAAGEIGVELSVGGTPQALKIGNGTSTWNALPYFIKAGGVPQPIAYGDAGAAGTSVEYARSDHRHQTPVTPPVTPTTVSEESTNSTTSTSHTHALSGVLTQQRNFNFGELHKFYSGTNGRSWLGLLNLTRFSFHPLNNALIMAGYVDWLYNLDRRADELGGDITFTQTANITPTIKTNLFTGVISQGSCDIDLTGVVESDPLTWAQFTIERTSGANIFSSSGTASTLYSCIGFLSVMEGWGSIGYDTSHNVITSLLIEVKPTTGTYAGQWYTLYDHTEAMNHALPLTRGICFSMTDQTLLTDGVVSYSGIRVSIRGGVPYSGTKLKLGNFCVFSNYPVSDPANVAKALGQRGGKGYGTYTIVGSGAKALEIRTPSGAIVGTFRADNPRLGIGTDAPSEAIDVNTTARFRGLAGTGIRILSVSATGVLTVDTVANLLTYLGASASGHDHSGVYLQLTGGTISGAMTFSSTIKASGLGSDIAGGLAVKVLVLNATNDIRTMSKADFITMVLDGHTHAYLPIAGGTVTGATTFSSGFALSALDAAGTGNFSDIVIMDSAGKFYKYNYETFCSLFARNGHAHSYLPLTGGGLSGSLGVGLGLNQPSENLDVNGTIRTRGIAEGGTLPVFVDTNGKFFKKTVAQAISDMALLTASHDALFNVHGRVITHHFSDLTQESDNLGKLAWLDSEKRMAYGLGYGGTDGVWQYLGITKVFPTVNDLMSEQPISEGIIACAITERIAFVSFWDGYDYQWSPLVNEDELLRRSCLPWEGLPSSPMDGHFQISYDKDVISFYSSTGGWQHLPVDSVQRIASPDDDYIIDPVLDKLILVDCTDDDVIITMPVIAQSMGREFIIRYHKGANVVTIIGQSANTVDGQASITLTTVKDFVRLINDGNADWCLVGGAYT